MALVRAGTSPQIAYRAWPAPSPKAAVCLLHGLGGHSQRWEACAEYLLERGVSSYALELRGFGEAPGTRGHVWSFEEYYRDIASLAGVMRRESPEARLFLAGESLGGLIAFHAAQRMPGAWRGVICISPAFKSTIPFLLRHKAKFALGVCGARLLRVPFPMREELCTRDGKFQVILRHDPREVRFATAQFFWNTIRAQRSARREAAGMREPLLFLLAGDDRMVENPVSMEVFGRVSSADKQVKTYPGMRHALSIEEGREAVFADMCRWMLERAA